MNKKEHTKCPQKTRFLGVFPCYTVRSPVISCFLSSSLSSCKQVEVVWIVVVIVTIVVAVIRSACKWLSVKWIKNKKKKTYPKEPLSSLRDSCRHCCPP